MTNNTLQPRGKCIIVTIDPKGNASIDLHGFHGDGCAEVVRSFGGKDQLLSEDTKPEFYEAAEEQKELNTL